MIGQTESQQVCGGQPQIADSVISSLDLGTEIWNVAFPELRTLSWLSSIELLEISVLAVWIVERYCLKPEKGLIQNDRTYSLSRCEWISKWWRRLGSREDRCVVVTSDRNTSSSMTANSLVGYVSLICDFLWHLWSRIQHGLATFNTVRLNIRRRITIKDPR